MKRRRGVNITLRRSYRSLGVAVSAAASALRTAARAGLTLPPEEKKTLLQLMWRRLYTDQQWLRFRNHPPRCVPYPWREFWAEEWDYRTLLRPAVRTVHVGTLLRAACAPAPAEREHLLRAGRQ